MTGGKLTVSEARRRYLRRRALAGSSALKRSRLMADMSLRELAEAADVSPNVLIRGEAGGTLTDESWWKIAGALGCPRETIDLVYAERLADSASDALGRFAVSEYNGGMPA
jgi:transcriptional regulator with XRE-family HTH domain